MARRQLGKRARARCKVRHAATKAMKKRCPCGKVHAASRGEAEQKYLLASVSAGGWNRVRFYECAFGGWHWTRQLHPSPTKRAPAGPGPDELTPEQQAWIDDLTAEASRPQATSATLENEDDRGPVDSA